MGLSLQSLSITSLFNSIVSFFKSQENNSKWKDLTTGAEGIFLIRMLSNVLSNISYRLVAARRENYISTANLLSSNLGIAVNLGYSAFRGTNQKRLIELAPDYNVTLPKFTIIGKYNSDYDIIALDEAPLLKDPVLSQGTATDGTLTTLHDASKNWIVNQYKGYKIRMVSGTGAPVNSIDIISNTTNTITYKTQNFQPDNTTTYEITEKWGTKVRTVIGKVKELTFVAGTSKVKVFQQYTENISEDLMLLVENKEVPTTSQIKGLKDDKYLVRTNPFNSIDILYLNNSATGAYKYGTETNITVRYIELADVETILYTSSMFTYGTLNNTLTIDNYVPFESVDSIKINAPLDHETQNLIRSKADYSQRVKQNVTNIVETSYTPITPTYTLVTYLKDDYTTLKLTDKAGLKDILVEENYFGTPLPDITIPVRESNMLDIYLNLSNKYVDVSDIDNDIKNIFKNNYAKALKQTFNTYTLERLLEDNLSYVKYARVNFTLEDRKNTNIYQLGSMIKVGDYAYKASKIQGISGTAEPHWNLPINIPTEIDTELETKDNNIIWRAYKKLNIPSMKKWEKTSNYAIGDYVYTDAYPNYMFKCSDLVKSTGGTLPITTGKVIGDFIVDGNIVWVCKIYNISYSDWSGTTNYRLGDSVNINGQSFECVSYVGTTGGAQPSFELLTYPIATFDSTSFTLSGDKTSKFKVGDVIKAITPDNKYTFSVLSCIYDEGASRTVIVTTQPISTDYVYSTLEPTLRGTRDGEILWELVPDVTEITFSWNVYNVFSYRLTTS